MKVRRVGMGNPESDPLVKAFRRVGVADTESQGAVTPRRLGGEALEHGSADPLVLMIRVDVNETDVERPVGLVLEVDRTHAHQAEADDAYVGFGPLREFGALRGLVPLAESSLDHRPHRPFVQCEQPLAVLGRSRLEGDLARDR